MKHLIPIIIGDFFSYGDYVASRAKGRRGRFGRVFAGVFVWVATIVAIALLVERLGVLP